MTAINLPCPQCGKPTFTVNSRWPPTKIMGLAGSKCADCGHVLSESERDDALLKATKDSRGLLRNAMKRAGFKPISNPWHTGKKKAP